MLSRGLAVGIVILFIVSAVIPMTIGNNIKKLKQNNLFENLTFICTDARGFSGYEFEHHGEYLSGDYSDNEVSIGPIDSPWPMLCHDVRHSSQSIYNTTYTNSVEKWRFYTDGWIEVTPVISNDGTVYFGQGWDLYAICSDGSLKWTYRTSGLISGSSPAIGEDGTIYVGSWDTKLYAINPNGTLKWRFSSGGSIFSSPTITDDGTIYLGTMSSGNSVVAVNPNGTLKWIYETGNSITSDPAIGEDGTVYIGSQDDYLYALWPNGTLRWRYKTGDYIMGPPSIAADGTIYIASWDDYLYALYSNNGTMKWRHPIGVGAATNPSIASDGTIYVGHDALYAIYPNGTRRWTFNLGPDRHIFGSDCAISADGIIYVGTNIGDAAGGEIIAINPDGTERWRKKIANEWVDSSPSIAEDGTVYIGSSYDMGRGYLHAFGTPEDNEPPNTPTITGPTNGNSGETYTYTLFSTDPENYPLKYYVDWGDGTNSGWTWEYDSGEEVELSHTWTEQGTYLVKAKAMDISNAESDWGTLSVTMPVNEIVIGSQFLQMLKQHPNMFSILRYMLLNQ